MGRWSCPPRTRQPHTVAIEAGAIPERIVGLVVAAALAGALAVFAVAVIVVAALLG